jgi:hypothetical protein
MANQDPGLRERQPWKAAYEKDYAWLNGVIVKHYHGYESDVKVLLGGVLRVFEGITIEAFEQQSGAFLRNEKHPTLHRPYLQITLIAIDDTLNSCPFRFSAHAKIVHLKDVSSLLCKYT